MYHILVNSPSQMSRFKAKSGLKPLLNAGLSAYVLERKLFNSLRSFFRKLYVSEDDIEYFDFCLKHLSKEKTVLMYEIFLEDGIRAAVKTIFNKEKQKKIYKKYKI